MSQARTAKNHECTNCGAAVTPGQRSYRYIESGLPNVILQGIEVADCSACGNSDVMIPRMAKIHRAIAQALTNSPARLTGPQLRFLRKRLGLSEDQLGGYLHTDRTKVSKWENGEDRIGPPRIGWSASSQLRSAANCAQASPPSPSIFRRSRINPETSWNCMSMSKR